MQSLRRIAAYLGAFAAISWIMVALSAAETADLPATGSSDRPAAEAGKPGSDTSDDLGNRLNRSSGVIRPPADVDPGLTQSPPQVGSSSMPVLRPPGTPGSGADVDPK